MERLEGFWRLLAVSSWWLMHSASTRIFSKSWCRATARVIVQARASWNEESEVYIWERLEGCSEVRPNLAHGSATFHNGLGARSVHFISTSTGHPTVSQASISLSFPSGQVVLTTSLR